MGTFVLIMALLLLCAAAFVAAVYIEESLNDDKEQGDEDRDSG